jgi:hypothetical protein
MHPVVHYTLEKQKKMTIFYGSALFFTGGLIYVGFKPDILPAYQTFCASISALAIGFFTAHAAQKNSEIKYQNGNVSLSEKEEVKPDANSGK